MCLRKDKIDFYLFQLRLFHCWLELRQKSSGLFYLKALNVQWKSVANSFYKKNIYTKYTIVHEKSRMVWNFKQAWGVPFVGRTSKKNNQNPEKMCVMFYCKYICFYLEQRSIFPLNPFITDTEKKWYAT